MNGYKKYTDKMILSIYRLSLSNNRFGMTHSMFS